MQVASKTATGIIRKRRWGISYLIHIHESDHVSSNDLESSTPWHVAFVFLIPVLLGAVQMHYQGSNKSPFETHLPNMLAFLLAILAYCFALVYIKSHRHPIAATVICSKFCVQVALISGYLASASLISVLLPRLLEPVIFIISILLSIYVARNPILHRGRSVFCSFQIVVSYIGTKLKQINGKNNDDPATTVTA